MSLAQIHERFSEPTDAGCELRIIAQDSRGLSVADRASIKEAADEYDRVCELLVKLQQDLIDSRQRQLVLGERLLEVRGQFQAYIEAQSWLVTVNVGPERYGPLRGILDPYQDWNAPANPIQCKYCGALHGEHLKWCARPQ